MAEYGTGGTHVGKIWRWNADQIQGVEGAMEEVVPANKRKLGLRKETRSPRGSQGSWLLEREPFLQCKKYERRNPHTSSTCGEALNCFGETPEKGETMPLEKIYGPFGEESIRNERGVWFEKMGLEGKKIQSVVVVGRKIAQPQAMWVREEKCAKQGKLIFAEWEKGCRLSPVGRIRCRCWEENAKMEIKLCEGKAFALIQSFLWYIHTEKSYFKLQMFFGGEEWSSDSFVEFMSNLLWNSYGSAVLCFSGCSKVKRLATLEVIISKLFRI